VNEQEEGRDEREEDFILVTSSVNGDMGLSDKVERRHYLLGEQFLVLGRRTSFRRRDP
jgi:hypothetical protein